MVIHVQYCSFFTSTWLLDSELSTCFKLYCNLKLVNTSQPLVFECIFEISLNQKFKIRHMVPSNKIFAKLGDCSIREYQYANLNQYPYA